MWLLRKLSVAAAAWAAVIVAVALIYLPLHWAYLPSLPSTPLSLAREFIEHVGAGVLWGILFWKRGIFGHISAHLPLQLGWSLLI